MGKRYAYFVVGTLSTGERVVHRIPKKDYEKYKKESVTVYKEKLKGKGFVTLSRLYPSRKKAKRVI